MSQTSNERVQTFLNKRIGYLGGAMDFVTSLFNGLSGINFEAIAQLTMLALIVIAGPAVIFVLAFRGGDL